MANSIRSIALEKLIAHPDNPNRMSNANLAKLVRNIERTGRYEPITVRPHPQKKDCFQIINGYHRCHALTKLGYKTADCIVWDIDDKQTDILLATLNRLPATAKQIERLTNLKMPSIAAKTNAKCLSNPIVFFVNDARQETIENALSLAQEFHSEETKAARRAAALAQIAEHFLNHSKFNSRT